MKMQQQSRKRKLIIILLLVLMLIAVVWNICEANTCFMKQQPDPNRNFLMRWVLPYVKDVRCSCTQIQLYNNSKCSGRYHITMPEAKDYCYTDDPSVFVNTESQRSLQMLLKCDKGTSSLFLS